MEIFLDVLCFGESTFCSLKDADLNQISHISPHICKFCTVKSKMFILLPLSNVWSDFLWKESQTRDHKRAGTVSSFSLFLVTPSLVLCVWSINSGWNAFHENSCSYYFLTTVFLSIVDWLTLKFQWV